MAEVYALNTIEERLRLLEERVMPEEKPSIASTVAVCDVVYKTRREMKKIEMDKPSIAQLWKKIHILEELLKYDFMENVVENEDTKTELILAEESVLRNTADQLQEIDRVKNELEKDDLRDIKTWSTKLEPLSHIAIEQKSQQEELGQRFTDLLNTYNEIISGLSKQFIEWDNVLTQCEIAFDSQKSSSD